MVAERGGIFIALGSNVGERETHIRTALAELEAQGDVRVLACSTMHESEAVGGPPGQPSYLNAVAELATELEPYDLLARLHAIEARHGRVRTVRNGPRTLDLDLLVYRARVIDDAQLCVPHPRMWQRSFVMEPLAEICDLARLVAAYRLHQPQARSRSEGVRDVRRYRGGAQALA